MSDHPHHSDPAESCRAIVLMYHRIAAATTDPWALAVSPEHFAEHLAVLTRVARPVPLSAVASEARPLDAPPAVAVTFDDGYLDNLTVAAPLLACSGIPATVFVTAGALDAEHEFWWDELEALLLGPGPMPRQLSVTIADEPHVWPLGAAVNDSTVQGPHNRRWRIDDPPPGPRQELYRSLWRLLQPLDAETRRAALAQIRQWAGRTTPVVRPAYRTLSTRDLQHLASCPGIEIGAHTITHPVLPAQAIAEQQRELQNSRTQLEAVIGAPVRRMSYPYGAFTEDTTRLVQAAGYAAACTTTPGCAAAAAPYAVPRFQVEDWSGAEFADRLAAWSLPTRAQPRRPTPRVSAPRPEMQMFKAGGALSLPEQVSVRSFLAAGHRVRLYCYEPVEGAPAEVVLADASAIMTAEEFRQLRVAGDRPDVFRFALLHARGGWWADLDTVCLRAIPFQAEHVFAAEPADAVSYGGAAVAANVIRQPAGSELMRWMWRACWEIGAERRAAGDLEPYLLHRGVHLFGHQEDVSPTPIFNPIGRSEWATLFDASAPALGAEVHTLRLWADSWPTREFTAGGSVPAGCLFDTLIHRFLER